ncbi:hypothetical protein M1B72_11800 [Geomonas paludis]|uniref:Uncharacterized protein n=1 Tax=Geomonas paludis TaxID=2740185 RepID=A0A6V8MVP0_9BACT|nr:hypothetical protein [Geomonas paludis]UPU34138.1 hypothetical protein M1B72_11800 [Geomonas paludis]GFO64111.1 hypothetical protein GMPD_20300 [Geomonas paludis]
MGATATGCLATVRINVQETVIQLNDSGATLLRICRKLVARVPEADGWQCQIGQYEDYGNGFHNMPRLFISGEVNH